RRGVGGADGAGWWRRRRGFKLGARPVGPGGRCGIVQHRRASRRPPYRAAAIRLHIDAPRELAGRAAQPLRMPENEMQPAAARAVDAGDGELGAMRMPPIARVAMFGVEVEYINAGDGAGAHADEWAAVAAPQLLHRCCILGGVEEAVGRARMLVAPAGEDGGAGASELEGGFKRLRATPLHWSASSVADGGPPGGAAS